MAQAKQAVQDAHSALQQAKDQLATDQKTQQSAQKAVDNFNAGQANSELASAQQSLTQAKQNMAHLQKITDNKAQAVKNAQATVKKDQNKLADLNHQLPTMKNAPHQLTVAKAELQKEQDTLKLFTEVIQQVQTKVNTAQKKANETAQVVRNAKLDLAEANAKLADAKMTDAQRYGKQVVVNPVNITAGDPVPAPKLANALTLPVSRANGVSTLSLVVNNGQAAELPAGTTAVWANEAQVKADAQQAGNYTEDVLVTFPDGSQVTAKAQMKVVAAKVAHQNSNAVISSSSKNGSSSTMTTSYTEGYESGSESSQNEFNGVNGNWLTL